MSRLQAALLQGPQYRAALHLLTAAPVFRNRSGWIESFLPEGGGIAFPRLLARGHWSTGERQIVTAAASVFGCRPVKGRVVQLNLLDLRTSLDAEARQVLYAAMEMASDW